MGSIEKKFMDKRVFYKNQEELISVKYVQVSIFLMVLMVLSSFSAINASVHSDNHGKTIYVSKNGTDRNDGLTPGKAKKNIENALNNADNGDTVIVGPGLYQINLNIVKNVSLVGNGRDTTVIEGERLGEGSPGCVHVQPGVNASITGFTIRNGNPGQYNEWGPNGGGVYNRGVLTLKDSTIRDCKGDYGGGIDNYGTLTIQNVTVKNNSAKYNGGGIHNKGPLLVEDCLITNNTATTYNGGGINSQAPTTIRRSTIQNNHANMDNGEGNGGGIKCSNILIVEDSIIKENTASNGGGIYPAALYLYNSTVRNNRVTGDGGGIYTPICEQCKSYVDELSLSLIHDNFPDNFGGKPYTPA